MKLVIALGISLVAVPSFASQAQRLRHHRQCGIVLDTVAAMEHGSEAKTIRSITTYFDYMPPLAARIRQMKANSHILDFGAGEGLAMAEYLGSMDVSGFAQARVAEEIGAHTPRANVTAFSYRMADDGAAYFKGTKGKLRTITGHFAEDDAVTPELLMGKFGPINLVIDHWGVLAYTADPTGVLRKLAPALARNAVIVVRTGPRDYDYRSGFGRVKQRSSLYRSKVDDSTIPDWLSALPGWHVADDGSVFDILIPNPTAHAIPQIWFAGLSGLEEPMPAGRIFERDRP